MLIEELIQRIESTSYRGPEAGHYLYAPTSRQLLEKRPLFRGGRVQTYAVMASATGEHSAEGQLGPIIVAGTTGRSRVQFYVHYRVWVEPQKVADLIDACAGDHPGRVLAEKVTNAAQLVVSRRPDAFDLQDKTLSETLLRDAEQLLLKEYGLNAILDLRPESSLPAPAIVTELDVYTRDYPVAIPLRVEIETCIAHRELPLAKVAMERRPTRYLEEQVERVTREVIRELQTVQLRRDLQGEVKRRLLPLLEKSLEPCYIGIRAVRLSLRQALAAPPEGHDADLHLELALPSYPTKLKVTLHLQLQRSDESTYWRAGGPNLGTWVEQEARRAVTRSLHGTTYSQLCLERQRWEAAVVDALRVAASAIGYTAMADVVLPPAPTWLLSPVSLEVRDTFATAVNDVPTELILAVRVRLDSLESIHSYLDRGIPLEAAFRAAICEEVAAYVHTLQPGHLFTAFNRPASVASAPTLTDPSAVGESTVESILRERVEFVLKRTFGMRVLSFITKLGPSPLRDIHDALLGATAIEFGVKAQLADHVEPVDHVGALSVTSVAAEDWAMFQRKRPSPEDIGFAASRAMGTLLDQQTRSGKHGLLPEEIRALVYERLPGEIRTLLGVTVRCAAWGRARGEDDEARTKYQRILRDAAYGEQLADYQERQKRIAGLRSQLLTAELAEDHEEIAHLTKQLERLRTVVAPPEPVRPQLPGPGPSS
jgi:hypothetical protein